MFSRGHLSYSSINTLATCGRRFKYQYIEQRPGVLTSRLVVGLAYHNTVATALNHKRLGLPLNDADIADAFRDFWLHEISDKIIHDEDGVPQIEAVSVDWGKDDPGNLFNAGMRLAQKYNHFTVPSLNPVAIETSLTIAVNGIPYPITGRLDLELPDRIADHKFRKNLINSSELRRDLQSMVYALLKQIQKPLIVEYHQALEPMAFANFPPGAGLKIEPVTRTPSDVEWVKELLREYWRQIEAEIFPPNPTSYRCSLEWCPYYINCKLEE